MQSLPVFKSLADYQRSWLSGDLVAGLTVWAVLVPEALAYASIAGVSPVVGLYAAPAALASNGANVVVAVEDVVAAGQDVTSTLETACS
jgi:MFS superfamily sulfate permease-like transporter